MNQLKDLNASGVHVLCTLTHCQTLCALEVRPQDPINVTNPFTMFVASNVFQYLSLSITCRETEPWQSKTCL